jgi:gamma-glutamylcysteine synthetase
MRSDQAHANLRNYFHSDDVKEMAPFAVDVRISGLMLRDLHFKWKSEESEFYRRLDAVRDQADAAAAPVALRAARLTAFPQRKEEAKFNIYGLDLSDPKWAEVAADG